MINSEVYSGMGICCSKEKYSPETNFENVVVAQMAREAQRAKNNQEPTENPLLAGPDKLEFQNVDFSNSSAEYDREELDALLRSSDSDDDNQTSPGIAKLPTVTPEEAEAVLSD